MSRRQERVNSLLRDLVAEFLNQHKELGTIVTVTKCEISDNLKTATCHLSVFPEEAGNRAVETAKRELHELREWLRTKLVWRTLPVLAFLLEKSDKKTD